MKGFKKGCYANGGMIVGPGTGTSDSIKKKVPQGSYIMPADSTRKIGGFRLSKMGEPLDVNVSNGEYEMPPEQVHAIGELTLDQMKAATHKPVGGFKRDDLFFANGGVVTDEEKRREALGLPYASQRQQALGMPGYRPASTLSPMPKRPGAAPVQTAPVAQSAPAPLGGSAYDYGAKARDAIGSGAGAVADTARASLSVADEKVATPVGGFMRGLFGAQPAAASQAAADTPPVRTTPAPPPQTNTAADAPPPPANEQTGPVVNSDKRVNDWLEGNRADRSDTLNAKNTVAVDGVDGLQYAGKYGETDVFRGTGGNGEAAFSDVANLATTRGGNAADLPKEGEAGFGNDVISNATAGSAGVATGGFSRGSDGSYGYVPSQLESARTAAMARGDYEAVDRSYMTSEERTAADQKKADDRLQADARWQDPAGTYQAELQDKAGQAERGFKEGQSRLLGNLYSRYEKATDAAEKDSILAEIAALTGSQEQKPLKDNFITRKRAVLDPATNQMVEESEIVDLRDASVVGGESQSSSPKAQSGLVVGAAAKEPDGEYDAGDGRIAVVKGGKVTEIR